MTEDALEKRCQEFDPDGKDHIPPRPPTPSETPPVDATATPPGVGDGPLTQTPSATAADKPAVPPAYAQFEVINWADTLGRAFVELRGRMGEAPIYRGVVPIERRFLDGLGFRGQRPFDIAATCVDEAFQKFDAARDAARAAGEEEADRDHTRAVLSGQIPPRPQMRMPPGLPQGTQRGRRRRN